MEILFHGASVTQQKGNASYFELLAQKLAPRTDIRLRRATYGGSHFSDAGFLTIDRDTADATDICLIDWNTTGLTSYEEDKLSYFAGVLIKKRILPVFLIFARQDTVGCDREAETQVKNFCAKANILCWDYRSLISPGMDLRDMVHTTESGALKYAVGLHRDLVGLLSSNVRLQAESNAYPFKEFKINVASCLGVDVPEHGSVSLTVDDIEPGAHVIFKVIRGPSSPIVHMEKGPGRVSVWDRWSVFERESYVTAGEDLDRFNAKTVTVPTDVLADPIDYTISGKDFTFEGTKIFKIREVSCVNCRMTNFAVRFA